MNGSTSFVASAREKTSVDANVPTAAERRMVRVEATVDRRSWGILRGRFRADGLATPRSGAPRPPRGPGEPARAKGSSRLGSIGHKVLPMFPVNSVTYVSGCSEKRIVRVSPVLQGGRF